jgi:hypothetical protein
MTSSRSTRSRSTWFERSLAVAGCLQHALTRVPPGWRWTLGFVPGLLVMLASLPLGLTHWGSEYVQLNDDAHTTNSGQVFLFGAVAFVLLGILVGGIIAASKPRTWRSLRAVGIAEALMIALTGFLFLTDNGGYLPVIMLGLAGTVFPIALLGCLVRIGYDALRARRISHSM